jgi:hypothetical protein
VITRTQLLNMQPWRFQPGAKVYARNWSEEQPLTVIEQLHGCGVPHYRLLDAIGDYWRMSQLELSTKPIPKER